MTRKEIKKYIAKLKRFKAALPKLIDCSEVYGDGYYTQKDMIETDKKIEELQSLLQQLPSSEIK